jgi:hypothetical protein
MKYLSALKEENPPNEEIEKPKNPYHDVLQKVQKPLFTVFTVREGGTSQKKTTQLRRNKKRKDNCDKCSHHEELPKHGPGCVSKTTGKYKYQWSRLGILQQCPQGYWN